MHYTIRLTILMVLSCALTYAQNEQNSNQEDRQSFESWNGAKLSYEIHKKVDLTAEVQVRLKSVGETYKSFFVEFQGEYQPFSFLDLGLGYRNFDKLDDVGKKQGHDKFDRLYGFLQTKTSLDRFDFGFRVMHQVKNQRNALEMPKDNTRWRYKFFSQFDIPNWSFDPRMSVEFFMLDEVLSTNAYDKIRLSLGTKKNLKGPNSLSFKYLYQSEVQVKNPLSYHILSLKYEYSIRPDKRE